VKYGRFLDILPILERVFPFARVCSREDNLIVDKRWLLHFFDFASSLGERYVHTAPENARLDASKNEHDERNVRWNVGHSSAKMQMNRLRHEIGMAPRSLVTYDVGDPR